jgi:glycosyltransferase involved in cell wall biosynthesis
MRIGIDARFLTHPQAGGFKTYTENLIHALGQIDNVNDYVIYVDRWSPEITSFSQNNFYYQVVDGTFPLIGMPVREQIALRGYIAKDKLDVVHFLCNTAPIAMKEKYIVTLHDTIQINPGVSLRSVRSFAVLKRWVINAYSKQSILAAAPKADHIITVSNSERDNISRILQIPLDRISVVYQGLNPIYKAADPEQRKIWKEEIRKNLKITDPFILSVGYEPRKNVPLIIEALSRLKDKNPDLSLVIVASNNSFHGYFRELAHKHQVFNRTKILGAISVADLVKLYNLTRAFVFPSEREGYGLPPLEALICGAPTIAMNCPPLPEILQGGALFIDGKDPQIWAQSIESVLLDHHLCAELLQRGRRRALELNWEQCAQATLQVYRSVFSNSSM